MNKLKLFIPPPVVFIVTVFLMWLFEQFTPHLTFRMQPLLWLCFILWQTGIVLGVWALISFIRAHTTINPHKPAQASLLVTSGVFHYSRNPMYLGLACCLLGTACYQANLAALLPIVGFVGYITVFQIMPEEEVLLDKFGEQFEVYRAKTRRWL